MIKVFRPSATQKSQHKILRDIQKNLGLETSGVFTSLEGDDAERVATACGLPKLSTTTIKIIYYRYLTYFKYACKHTPELHRIIRTTP